MINNNRGQMLIINLMMAFLAVVFLVALVPGFRSMIESGLSNSAGLNCEGAPDYNASASTSDMGCIGINLIIPFIILGTLVAIVATIFYGRSNVSSQPQYGG